MFPSRMIIDIEECFEVRRKRKFEKEEFFEMASGQSTHQPFFSTDNRFLPPKFSQPTKSFNVVFAKNKGRRKIETLFSVPQKKSICETTFVRSNDFFEPRKFGVFFIVFHLTLDMDWGDEEEESNHSTSISRISPLFHVPGQVQNERDQQVFFLVSFSHSTRKKKT